MADDDDNDSQALTGGDITRYGALVARISYLSQDRPDLKFASMQVCCAMAKPSVRDMERAKRIGRYLAGKPRAQCGFRLQQSGELDVYSDWEGDKTTRRSVSAVVVMRGGHCLKVWTKKQQVVSLHLDASATMCLVNRRGLGEAKHMQKLDTGGFHVGPVHHEEGRHERESIRLDDASWITSS